MHDAPQDVLVDAYPEEEYWQDLLKVTGGAHRRAARAPGDPRARRPAVPWMKRARRALPAAAGGHAAPGAHQRLLHGRRQGAGQRLLPQRASARRARSRYDAAVDRPRAARRPLRRGARRARRAHRGRGTACWPPAASSRTASGCARPGANERGEPADNFLIRGTRFNTRRAAEAACSTRGADADRRPDAGAHASRSTRARRCTTAASARASTASRSASSSTAKRERFYDEGEDFWPKRYAIWGRLVAGQPGQIAYSIIDAKAIGRFMPPVFPADHGATRWPQLARELGLDAAALVQTVAASTPPAARAPSTTRCSTTAAPTASTPPKTHWARPIDTPPFYGYPLRPGITFTYLGVEDRRDARAVHLRRHGPAANLFVAGEMMAGNVLGKGYTAGLGMAIGTAFGRIAGRGGRAPCPQTAASADPARELRTAPAIDGPSAPARSRVLRSATPAATAKASARSSRR